MKPKQDMSMLEEDNNISDNFGLYKDEKFISEAQNIERNHRDLVSKSSDTRSHARNKLLECTFQDGLLRSKSSSSLIEVKFSKQDIPTSIPISNIKYHHPRSQNDNLFYSFHD